MKIYDIDPVAGEYLGERDARIVPGRGGRDDADPAKWLIPAHAVTVVPPSAQPGHAVCWRDGAWQQVEDHRGETVYATDDGRAREITAPGPLPDDVTTESRPSERHVWRDGAWGELPPPRRLVPKSVIVERLHSGGLLGAAKSALDADIYARERWYAPDRPAIYADDEEALALLNAVGADTDTIMAP